MNLLLVGAGQLGSRHLQSCLKLPQKLSISVLDSSKESIELSKTRADEIENKVEHSVKFYSCIDDINVKEFDFMINATGSAPRYKLLKDCLERFSVKYAILEKVLFQKLEDYVNAEALLLDSKTSAYVNCPLRSYPFYKDLKQTFINEDLPVHLKYRGGEWIGLGCNSIHYIDLVAYLSGETLFNINCDNVDSEIIKSRREGYIEFTGEIEGTFSSNSNVSINSIKDSEETSIIEIVNGDIKVIIDELTGAYEIIQNGESIKRSTYEIMYQSNLTHLIIEQLLESRTCDLTPFNDSSYMHQMFISQLLQHMNKQSVDDVSTLPIT